MIEIKTVQNNTGRGKTGFCFQSVADSEAGLEEIVNEMVDYNSTLTEADTKAALVVLDAVVKKIASGRIQGPASVGGFAVGCQRHCGILHIKIPG